VIAGQDMPRGLVSSSALIVVIVDVVDSFPTYSIPLVRKPRFLSQQILMIEGNLSSFNFYEMIDKAGMVMSDISHEFYLYSNLREEKMYGTRNSSCLEYTFKFWW
jgi:hypothetical protein